MASVLGRDDIIDGLRDLVGRARTAGVGGATIRIVGGAALRLAYFDRPTTVDIDARIEPYEEIEPLARQIAEERNWPDIHPAHDRAARKDVLYRASGTTCGIGDSEDQGLMTCAETAQGNRV